MLKLQPEVPVPVAAIPVVASEDGPATSDSVPAPTPEIGTTGAAPVLDAAVSGSAVSEAPHAVSTPDATPTPPNNSTEPSGESASAVPADPGPVWEIPANAAGPGSSAAVTAPSTTPEEVETVSEPCSQTGWKRLGTFMILVYVGSNVTSARSAASALPCSKAPHKKAKDRGV